MAQVPGDVGRVRIHPDRAAQHVLWLPAPATTRSNTGRQPVTLAGVAQQSDLESRVAILEMAVRELVERVRHSEQDVTAARVLAGGADRDVAEIRGEIREFREQNTRVLNAMREDLIDLRQRVETGFKRVEIGFVRVDNGFTEMRGKLDGAAAGQQQIVTLLNTFIGPQGDQGGSIGTTPM